MSSHIGNKKIRRYMESVENNEEYDEDVLSKTVSNSVNIEKVKEEF